MENRQKSHQVAGWKCERSWAVLSRSRTWRLLKPISCGRNGEAPLIIRLPKLHAEATKIADLLNAAHQEGHAWGDMAVICRRYDEMDECAQALSRWQLPFEVRAKSGSFHPHEDTIKVLTMHASKGLEFPVVALMGVGQMPAAGEDEREEARLFYVGRRGRRSGW
jgi:superfamily I DNA/RNA helicase